MKPDIEKPPKTPVEHTKSETAFGNTTQGVKHGAVLIRVKNTGKEYSLRDGLVKTDKPPVIPKETPIAPVKGRSALERSSVHPPEAIHMPVFADRPAFEPAKMSTKQPSPISPDFSVTDSYKTNSAPPEIKLRIAAAGARSAVQNKENRTVIDNAVEKLSVPTKIKILAHKFGIPQPATQLDLETGHAHHLYRRLGHEVLKQYHLPALFLDNSSTDSVSFSEHHFGKDIDNVGANSDFLPFKDRTDITTALNAEFDSRPSPKHIDSFKQEIHQELGFFSSNGAVNPTALETYIEQGKTNKTYAARLAGFKKLHTGLLTTAKEDSSVLNQAFSDITAHKMALQERHAAIKQTLTKQPIETEKDRRKQSRLAKQQTIIRQKINLIDKALPSASGPGSRKALVAAHLMAHTPFGTGKSNIATAAASLLTAVIPRTPKKSTAHVDQILMALDGHKHIRDFVRKAQRPSKLGATAHPLADLFPETKEALATSAQEVLNNGKT